LHHRAEREPAPVHSGGGEHQRDRHRHPAEHGHALRWPRHGDGEDMKRLLPAVLLCCGCQPKWFVEPTGARQEGPPSPERGRALLLNKSYLKVGVPFAVSKALYPSTPKLSDSPEKLEGRTRINALLPTGYTGRVLGDGVNAATEN